MADITPGWGTQWEALANAINDYYGAGVGGAQYEAVVNMLNSGNYTMAEMESILGQIPEFSRTYNANGQLTSVSYKASTTATTVAESAANAINSNVANGSTTQFSTAQTITKNQQTGKVTIGNEVVQYKSGYAGVGKVTMGNTLAALAAVSSGILLGKTIDSTLYNINPDFWDEHGMSMLNPESWGNITNDDDSLLADLFNFVFDIDPNSGNPQAYIDQEALAYMTAYMGSQGVFDDIYSPTPTVDNDIVITGDISGTIPTSLYNSNASDCAIYTAINYNTSHPGSRFYVTTNLSDPDAPKIFADFVVVFKTSNGDVRAYPIWNESIPSNYATVSAVDAPGNVGWLSASGFDYTCNGHNYYIASLSPDPTLYDLPTTSIGNTQAIAFAAALGANATGASTIQGITNQPGAQQFNASSISDYSDINAVLAELQSQYPDLWNNRIEISPDGDNVRVYVPVGFPTGGTGAQPTSQGATQQNTAPDISGSGSNATDELIKTLIDIIQQPYNSTGMESNTNTPTKPVDPNDPGTGTGTTPVIVLPTGSASALYSIYNPSQAQLNSLGAWLWSSNFVDQLLKIFNDPMQAIIGLHKVFVSPPLSGSGTIKVGYLDSGVSSNLVGAQYTSVNCGSVNMKEYFKNELDYTQTDVYLYLPFIGIVPLNVVDVMRGTIKVQYKVDVLTGACLANVDVTRDAGSGGQLYTYAGNCAVQYPLSSGSYMGILAGALGIAGSVASTILSGGSVLPMALGAGAAALTSAKTKVEHSGSLSGNAGAMGIKKPYLIIRRPQTKIADGFQEITGEMENVIGTLSGFTGFTRIKYVQLKNIPASGDEINEIDRLLKEGIIL